MPEPDYNVSAVSSAPTSSPRPQSRPSGLGSRPGRNMDADMYAGSSYAPTSGAGTSSATQTFSSSATSTGSFAAAATANDDDGPSYGQLYSNTAMALTAAGATLKAPTQAVYNPMNLYSSQNMQEISTEINDYLRGTAIDDAMREALNLPEVYQGAQTEEEPDPNITDPDVLRDALQPEPITVEELPDGVGGLMSPPTLGTIAPDAGVMNFSDRSALTNMDNLQLVDIEDETSAVTTSPRPQGRINKYESMLSETGSEQIKGIQGVLTELGYVPRGIDGTAGAGTEAALRSFQEQNNLPVTGIADAATITKLQSDSRNSYTFSNVTDNVYEEFADVESDEAHLGTDRDTVGITLAYGIVPTSGLKYNHRGTIIDLPREENARWAALTDAGVTTRNFDPENVITDDAVKEGVKRSDYRSDEEWTKAVITAFEDKVKARARALDVDLSEEATEALVSYTWNTGSGTLSGNSMTTAITELGNDNPNYTNIANGFLNRFTRRGGGILQGLGRRRANEANTLLEAVDSPWTIEFYRMQRTPQGRNQFVFTTSEGTEMVVNADDGTRGMDAESGFPRRNTRVN